MGSSGSKIPRQFSAGDQKIRSTILAQNFEEIRSRCLSTGTLFQDPLFPAVDSSVYFSQSPNFSIEWLRPHEIARRHGLEPHFIFKGTNRFDVIQGDLGDCWVLAALASLAEHRELLAHVVPEGQTFASNWYAGVFHFRFYHFGQWVDVVVDDRLPCKQGGELFMLQSEYRNEFWGIKLLKILCIIQNCLVSLIDLNCFR